MKYRGAPHRAKAWCYKLFVFRKIMAAFETVRQRNLKKIAAQRELRMSLRGMHIRPTSRTLHPYRLIEFTPFRWCGHWCQRHWRTRRRADHGGPWHTKNPCSSGRGRTGLILCNVPTSSTSAAHRNASLSLDQLLRVWLRHEQCMWFCFSVFSEPCRTSRSLRLLHAILATVSMQFG